MFKCRVKQLIHTITYHTFRDNVAMQRILWPLVTMTDELRFHSFPDDRMDVVGAIIDFTNVKF